MLRFELRTFDGSHFGEGFERAEGENLAAFEEYCEQFTHEELQDEPARPYRGIVAGRQFHDFSGKEVSAFAYRIESDD